MNLEQKRLFRMLDANYNRAKEALRVAEDVLRFAEGSCLRHARGNSKFPSSQSSANAVLSWKKIRHRLSHIFFSFPQSYKAIVACRNVERDTGKALQLDDRKGRVRVSDLFCSNVQRAEEAVRVLEECSKAVYPKAAPKFQKLRFDIYAMEKRDIAKF